MPLSSLEQTVVRAIAEREDELVDLAGDLIAFDTTARDVGDPPRREADLQSHLADRISRVGAQADLFEPDGEQLSSAPLVPPGLEFNGRPQLIATLRALSGRTHEVVSGVVAGERSGAEVTRVTFHALDDALLEWYVASGAWRGRAGGYAIQGRGAALVEAIEGDFWNVVGLPLAELLQMAPDLAR